jgi:hypothetical protein
VAACARVAPPSGGPEDREPPRLLARSPDSGEVSVALDQPVTLTFSERMDRGTVNDWFRIAPWPGRLDAVWEATRFVCRPSAGWIPGTTYTVLLGAKAEDRRGNKLAAPIQFAFSTGDSLALGRVLGEVRTRALSTEGAPVFLFPWPAELRPPLSPSTALRLDPLDALRIAETDAKGRFELRYVAEGASYLVAALYDRNGDRRFDEDEDLWGFAEDPAGTTALADTLGIPVYLVYSDEPGDLAGTVTDSACSGYAAPARLRAVADSLGAILTGERDADGFLLAAADSLTRTALAPAEEESLRSVQARVVARIPQAVTDSLRCSSPIWVGAFLPEAPDSLPLAEVRCLGEFRLSGLASGLYRLRAYRDLDGDGRRSREEPQGDFPFVIELKPGRELTALEWTLGIPGPAGP